MAVKGLMLSLMDTLQLTFVSGVLSIADGAFFWYGENALVS